MVRFATSAFLMAVPLVFAASTSARAQEAGDHAVDIVIDGLEDLGGAADTGDDMLDIVINGGAVNADDLKPSVNLPVIPSAESSKSSSGQVASGPPENSKPPAAAGGKIDVRTTPEFRQAIADYIQVSAQTTWRCLGLLVFALVIICAAIYLTMKGHFGQLVTFKLIALTLVVTSGLVLVVAGYSSAQITSMMGLLGTVAGYVLGKGEDLAVQVQQPAVLPAPIPPASGSG